MRSRLKLANVRRGAEARPVINAGRALILCGMVGQKVAEGVPKKQKNS